MLEQKLKEYQAKLTENEQLENEMKVSLGGQELNFSIVDPSELENREIDVDTDFPGEFIRINDEL